MKIQLTTLIGSTEVPRPFVSVHIGGSPIPEFALVDSGALGNRFDLRIANALGLDIEDSYTGVYSIGGGQSQGYTTHVNLQLGSFTWRAAVTFLDNWPKGRGYGGVLGLYGFFDQYQVRFRPVKSSVSLRRIELSVLSK